ncbi:MAG: chromate transporter [Candidatus Omnitrophica bacterium]|nr:chromate transporter [Candidatus Omnitrophota bacterium]
MLWEIFLVFLRIGLFAIGGAYSFLPLLQKEIVEIHAWLSKEEFLEVLGMVKIFPGAISIKFATYTGYKMAGIPGAVVANFANLLSPALLIFLATIFYRHFKNAPQIKGAFDTIQLAVFAMILAVAFQTVNITALIKWQNIAIILLTFLLFMFTKIHPAVIIIGAGLIGAVFMR